MNILFMQLTGSRLYGTFHDNSDYDYYVRYLSNTMG